MKGKKLNSTVGTILVLFACLVAAFFLWLYFNIDGDSSKVASIAEFRGL